MSLKWVEARNELCHIIVGFDARRHMLHIIYDVCLPLCEKDALCYFLALSMSMVATFTYLYFNN